MGITKNWCFTCILCNSKRKKRQKNRETCDEYKKVFEITSIIHSNFRLEIIVNSIQPSSIDVKIEVIYKT